MNSDLEYCRRLVARHDPDRYKISLFSPRKSQAYLWALYAFNVELSMIAGRVKEPILGMVRLAFWRDSIVEIYQGKTPRAHSVLVCLAEMIKQRAFAQDEFLGIIEARAADLNPVPFANDHELKAYLNATASALFRLSFVFLGEEREISLPEQLGSAWGIVGLLRSRAYWRQGGRDWRPQSGELDVASYAHEARSALAQVQASGYRGSAGSQLLFARLAGYYLDRLESQDYGEAPVERPSDIWRLALNHWSKGVFF